MLRNANGTWIAGSTPFWGSYAKPGTARQAPLATLWTLRHWPTNEVRSLDQMAALRIAVENAVLPSADPEMKRAVFEVAADLAANVPASELRFTPVTSLWEEIDVRAVA
jgi:hypothetical protein